MYIIKDLNKLYQDVKNYIKGESLIQSDYLFKIEYNNLSKECIFKIHNYNLEILIGEDNLFVDFDYFESNNLEASTLFIYNFILDCFDIKEHISDLYLEESYSNKLISLSLEHNFLRLLYFTEDKSISERTNKPFFIIKKEKILLNIINISINSFVEDTYYLYIDENNTSYSMRLLDSFQINSLRLIVDNFNK